MDSDRTARRGDGRTEAGPWPLPSGAGVGAAGPGLSPAEDAGPREGEPGEVATGVLDRAAASLPQHDLHGINLVKVPPSRGQDASGVLRRTRLTEEPLEEARRRPRPHRWRLRAVYTALVVVLVVGLAVGVTSRARLHRTNAEVTSTQARLHHTLEQARRAEATLTAVSAQASSAAHILGTETAQLASVQSQLASTEADVFANGVSINDLDLCLAGVEQALNQISLNDQSGAAATLDGVAASCRGAAPSP